MVCKLPSARSLSKARSEGALRENMAKADMSASAKAISVSPTRSSGRLAKPLCTKRKSASADRCFRPCGATMDMENPITRRSKRSSQGVFSHLCLRKASSADTVVTRLGGSSGIAGHAWSLRVSRNTLLRLLRPQPLPDAPTPRVLGVDDFALRKRQTYGTVLIALERRQPVALLPDREGDTCAQWLQAHPGVAVITRDRSKAYADGARHGAPKATQVAERFHLFQNVAETLPQIFNRHSPAFQVVNEATGRTSRTRPAGTVVVPVPPSSPPRH